MPHSPRAGDFADSPEASEPADFSGVDKPLDHAAELIADAIRADSVPLPCARATFETHAVRILAAPVAAVMGLEADASQPRAKIIHQLLGEASARLLREVNVFRDPVLAFRCLGVVFSSTEESEQDIACEFGIERATVSGICVSLCDRLHVPPGRGMRTTAARQKYAARQAGKRARPKATAWPFGGLLGRVKLSLVA